MLPLYNSKNILKAESTKKSCDQMLTVDFSKKTIFHLAETYSEPSQISLFAKIINYFFTKRSALDLLLGSECASEISLTLKHQRHKMVKHTQTIRRQ